MGGDPGARRDRQGPGDRPHRLLWSRRWQTRVALLAVRRGAPRSLSRPRCRLRRAAHARRRGPRTDAQLMPVDVKAAQAAIAAFLEALGHPTSASPDLEGT